MLNACCYICLFVFSITWSPIVTNHIEGKLMDNRMDAVGNPFGIYLLL